MNKRFSFLFALLLLLGTIPVQATNGNRGITFQGVIKDTANPTSPIFPSSLSNVIVQILGVRSDGNSCILWQEMHTGVQIEKGYLYLVVGKGTKSPLPNLTFDEVFDDKPKTGLTCSNGHTDYTPDATDSRKLRIVVNSLGITADFNMRAAPYAVRAEKSADAEKLDGKSADQFLAVNTPAGLTQSAAEAWFSSTVMAELLAGTFAASTAVTATNVTGTVAIANGGTGATTAAAARTNLGLGPLAAMNPTGTADANSYLRGDGSWASLPSAPNLSGDVSGPPGANTVDKIKGTDVNVTGLAAGHFFRFDGGAWINGALTATDVPSLDWSKITSGKPTSLAGYGITDAVSKNGDTMAGTLNMDSNNITNAGYILMSPQRALGLGAYSNAQEATLLGSLTAAHKGYTWFNSDENAIKFWNGATAQALGIAGSGITSFAGQSGGSQSLAVGTSGSAPAWNSASNTHTLNIPMASSGGVTAGLISKSDYDTFNAKQPAGSYVTDLTGDVIASGPGSAAATIAAGAVNSAKIQDGSVVKADMDFTGVNTATTNVALVDTNGKFTELGCSTNGHLLTWTAAGFACQAPTPLLPSLANGNIWIGNGSSVATAVTVSGDATLSASGALTLANSGVTAGTYSKLTVDAKGRVTGGANIASSDVTTALGFTPVNKAGDVMTGSLGLGNYTDATETTLISGWGASDKGKTWFNTTSNQVKYWDGSAVQALGISGAGLTSLNGQSGSTQTFAAPGTAGTAPAWSSAGNSHTLNIPLAATAGVTAGLISKSDYDTFNNKQPAGSYMTALTGDVTAAGPGSSAATIAANAVTSGKIADGTIQGTDLNFTGVNSVTTGLVMKDATGKFFEFACATTGHVPTWSVTGFSCQAPTPLLPPLPSGTIWVGNGSSVATAVTMSGDATISSAGAITLKNTGTPGTYTKITTDAQGRVTSGTTLTASDIPNLDWTKITSGTPTTLGGYGITDGLQNAGGTPSVQTGTFAARPAFGTAGRLYIASDNNTLYRDTGAAWVAIGDGAGTGTVTSVTSTNSDISITNTTTTPALTLNAGTSGGAPDANKIAKLNGSGLLNSAMIPALDAAIISTGTLPIARGGTNSSTALVNNRIMASSAGAIIEAPAITANRALISNASGIPTHHPTVTNTELGYLSGVTSSIQTQLNAKTSSTGWTNYSVIGTNGSGTLTAISGATSGTILQHSPTGPVFSTATYPATTTANQLLFSSANNVVGGLTSANDSVLTTNGSGVPSWTTKTTDTFTQYALLAGRSGGQTLNGGTAASNNLTLDSTAHSTKGNILLNPTNGSVGIGTSTIQTGNRLDVRGGAIAAGSISAAAGNGGEVRLYEIGSPGTNYVGFKAPDSITTDRVWTLPAADGTANQVLQTNGAGVLSWATPSGGGSLSSLTAATATNTIDNLTFAQTWNWSTATTQNPLTINANSMTTGSILTLSSSNASLNSTNGLLRVANTGASTNGTVARIQSNSTAGSGLTVLANGYVGIGTTSPSTTLSVSSNATSDNTVVINNTNASANAYAGLALNSNASYFEIKQYSSTASSTGWSRPNGTSIDGEGSGGLSLVAGHASGALRFYAGGLTERMYIGNSGNVGIATASPTSILDVNGAQTMRGMSAPTVSSAGQGRIYFDSSTNKFRVSQNGGAYTDLVTAASGDFMKDGSVAMTGAFRAADGSAAAPSISFGNATTTGFYNLAGNMLFAHGGNNRFGMDGTSIYAIGAGVWRLNYTNTAASPAIGLAADTGFYRPNPSTIGVTTAGVERMRVDASGNVGIGTTSPASALHVVGDIQFTGTLTDISDRRLKKNIKPLQSSLELVRKIPVYSYVMRDDPEERVEYGVMAQDMMGILPDLVKHVDANGNYYGVNYLGLIPWTIGAIQQVDKNTRREIASIQIENSELKAAVKKLEDQNKALEDRLAVIEKQIRKMQK